MVKGEVYLGGFTSANLKKGLIKGYGVYITNKRIIGVKKRGWAIAGAIVGGGVGRAIAKKMTKDLSDKTIKELEQKKDFEAYKDQIKEIELKKPGFMRGGHLQITLKSGEKTKIKIDGKGEFEALNTMMNAFKPEALKVIK